MMQYKVLLGVTFVSVTVLLHVTRMSWGDIFGLIIYFLGCQNFPFPLFFERLASYIFIYLRSHGYHAWLISECFYAYAILDSSDIMFCKWLLSIRALDVEVTFWCLAGLLFSTTLVECGRFVMLFQCRYTDWRSDFISLQPMELLL